MTYGGKFKTKDNISIAAWLFMTAMFAIFFIAMPLYADDLWFSIHLKDGASASGIWQTWQEHWLRDNSRLANILVVPLLALPKWIGSLLASVAWCVAMRWSGKLISLEDDQWKGWLWLLSLLVLLLPWYDTIGALDYQFNYVVSTALSLGCILLVCDKLTGGWIAAFSLGLITGAWHEGFGIPIFVAITAMILIHKYRTRKVWMLMAGMTIGLCWLALSPGFWLRFGNTIESDGCLMHFAKRLVLHPALWIFIASLCVRPKYLKSILHNRAECMLLISGLTSFLIHIVSTVPPRTGWWCEVAFIALSVKIWSSARIPVHLRLFYTASTICVYLFSILQMAVTDIYALRIRRQLDIAIRKYAEDPHSTVFLDFDSEFNSPLWTGMKPDFTVFTSPVYNTFHNWYLDTEKDTEFVVVPKSLKLVTGQSGEAIKGNTSIRRLSDGTMFMPYIGENSTEMQGTVTFGAHEVENVRIQVKPFVSQGDGGQYAWVYPWRQTLPYKLWGVSAIKM